MKVLLIGPYPPPHGGISVHVSGIHRQLTAAGVTCRVLDTGHGSLGLGFCLSLLRHALAGWTLHLHTNGHNVKSWLVALGCGLANRFGRGSIVTLHSGMAPGYLETASTFRRRLAAFTCSLYTHIICVNQEIRDALLSLPLDSHHMEVLPAFLGEHREQAGHALACPESRQGAPFYEPGLVTWIKKRRPLFSTVLFFRPEYGFDVLVSGLARIKHRYPSLGCLVMGSGDQLVEAERRVRDADLTENVLLLGDVKHEKCVALMSVCDIFLRPTLEDGDSISVREALSLGVPVVASRVGTRPQGAILFPPGDVDEMLAGIERALSLKRGSQPRTDDCADRLMAIYRQVDGSEGSLCLN